LFGNGAGQYDSSHEPCGAHPGPPARRETMSYKKNIRVYIILIAVWLVLILLQYFAHKYLPGNYVTYAVDSLAPIPIIVLVVVFLVGMFMENREQKRRRQQLVFLKSCMFRLEMRNLYVTNFLALKSPALSFTGIKSASLDELKSMLEQSHTVEYKSLEAMEPVIMEYVDAQDVWRGFMEIAIQNGFEEIFQDMLFIVHFISDVITFKELNPDKLYVHQAANDEAAMKNVMKVLGDGVRKYLQYAIELKETQPELFKQVVGDYELLAQSRG
jgi:hypothetical protein